MWFKTLGVLAGAGLVLASCSSTSPTPGSSSNPGSPIAAVPQVLRVNLQQEPAQLDAVLASDDVSGHVLHSITRPLAYFDENLAAVPGLASSWDISADGKTITFHLGTHSYSTGEPIVAADFAYSWRKLADPRVAAEYSYSLEPVVGWSELQALDTQSASYDANVEAGLAALGVAAPDDKTFVVTLKRAASYFVYMAALPVGAPEKPTFTYGEAADYASSGPMMMKEWKHGSKIVLVPNPYWDAENPDDPVKIDEIEFSMVKDPAASLAEYAADELDITRVPRAEVNRVRGDPNLSGQIRESNVLSLSYFGFDMQNKDGVFTKSALLRKAFNEALDKNTMLATIFSGIGHVAFSVVPPGMPGHQDDQFIKFDGVQAKTDFDAALAALGTTADKLNLELGYNVAGSNEDLAIFLRDQWKTVFGIEVKLTSMGDFGAYLDKLTQDPFDIFHLGWDTDYPHWKNFLTDLISCDSRNNIMRYCNPAVDALLEEAASKATLAGQEPLYNRAQEIVMADAPIIPLAFGARLTLVKPWVQRLTLTALESNAGELFYYRVSIAVH